MNDLLTADLERDIEHRIMRGTTYLGVPSRKMPMDAWVYQEIIHELRPDVIVEVGNHAGGSLLYLADICATVGHGMVIGVDVARDELKAKSVLDHYRIELVDGDAIRVFADVRERVGARSCLVIEDSAHTYRHTLAVLRLYSQFVWPGGYLICEDGVMEPVAKAIKAFLAERDDFEADRSREWPLTWNPCGYLRRVA